MKLYPFSLANPVSTRLSEELYNTKYIVAPGPVPALHTVAKHGAQCGEGTLSAKTVIIPELEVVVVVEEEVDSVGTVDVETVVEVGLEPNGVADEDVDEDDETVVAEVVEKRLEDEVPEKGDINNGDDKRANTTMPITAKPMITETF